MQQLRALTAERRLEQAVFQQQQLAPLAHRPALTRLAGLGEQPGQGMQFGAACGGAERARGAYHQYSTCTPKL